MAEIISTLFGVSPQAIQQQREQQAQQQSLLLAQNQRNPIGAAIGLNFGQALGRGLLGGLGFKDPQLEQATKLQNVLQSVQTELGAENLANPELLAQVLPAKLNEAGLSNLAAQSAFELAPLAQDYRTRRLKAEQEQLQLSQEKQFREELLNLPVTASDDEIYAVTRKYGKASDILGAVEKRKLAQEQREGKLEELKLKLESDMQRARERNETLIEQARQQGANAAQIAQMRADSAEQIAQMRQDTAIQVASISAATKSANKGAPKDVAEAEAALTGVEYVTGDINKALDYFEKGKIDFSFVANREAQLTKLTNRPSENALRQDEVKRIIKSGVNQVLQAAKGTQTEGDAQRAFELFQDAEGTNSTESWREALLALKNAQQKVAAERRTYIKSRGFSSQPQASDNDPLGLRK